MSDEYYISNDREYNLGKSLVLESFWKDEYIEILRRPDIIGFTWGYGAKENDNLDFLEKLQGYGIRRIVISSHYIKDLTKLALLPELEMIMIQNLYTACPDFTEFPNLKILKLNYRASAKSMFGCQHLEYLYVEKYPYTDFSAIAHMDKLRDLVIRGGKLTSLKGIEQLHALKRLDIFRLNKLETLDGIEKLPGLDSILITKCKLITPDSPHADRVRFGTM